MLICVKFIWLLIPFVIYYFIFSQVIALSGFSCIKNVWVFKVRYTVRCKMFLIGLKHLFYACKLWKNEWTVYYYNVTVLCRKKFSAHLISWTVIFSSCFAFWQNYFIPIQINQSIACSFGWGRLGNQVNSNLTPFNEITVNGINLLMESTWTRFTSPKLLFYT